MKPKARRLAREFAVQAVYSWQMSKNPVEQIELSIVTSNNMQKVDTEYFLELLRSVVKDCADLDKKIKPYLGRLPEELDPVEKAILRIATYELVARIDVPYKVSINEAVNLAKKFGPEDSHKFVNGLLDKVAIEVRALEVAAQK